MHNRDHICCHLNLLGALCGCTYRDIKCEECVKLINIYTFYVSIAQLFPDGTIHGGFIRSMILKEVPNDLDILFRENCEFVGTLSLKKSDPYYYKNIDILIERLFIVFSSRQNIILKQARVLSFDNLITIKTVIEHDEYKLYVDLSFINENSEICDFSCNSLSIPAHSISPYSYFPVLVVDESSPFTVNQIIDQIRNKQTYRIAKEISIYRERKIIDKGFEILDFESE